MLILKQTLEALGNPFILLLLCYLFLLIKCYPQRKRCSFFWGFALIFIVLTFFSTGWLARVLTSSLEHQYPIVTQYDPSVQWVVVFGGGQSKKEDKPANMLLTSESLKRLVEGVRLYRQLPHAKLVVSGGSSSGISEAEHMGQIARWFAIPESDLVLETNSSNTASEAIEIKSLLGTQPFYLVTSAIHMPRSIALCQAQGLNPIAAPTDFTLFWEDGRWDKRYFPNMRNWAFLSIALHEIYGRAWSKIKPNAAILAKVNDL